ncbi:MAG: substrate-binding domain-containing protein [Haloarculaceae archaeon]
MSHDDGDTGEGNALNISLGKGISRRDVMRQLGATSAVGALGGMAGCSAIQRGGGGGGSDEAQGEGEGGSGGKGQVPSYKLVQLQAPPTELNFTREPPERSITMVTHDATTSFFDPTIAGLHDAAKQLGWKANFTGPTSGFSVETQVDLIENAIDAGPDLIATTVVDPSAYDKAINRALENDIPVITYNTLALGNDEMRDKYGQALAYVGQDNYAAGYVCGLAAIERMPDDASTLSVGMSDPGHSALSARADGIELAFKLNTDMDITNRINYTGDSNEGISRIENHITGNKDVDVILGTDAFTWFIGNALQNQNAVGDIMGGGFDLTPDTIKHVQNDVLAFTIGQDPYNQGYNTAKQAFTYLDRGMPPKDFLTGAEIIDSSNIDTAAKRSSQWGDLREYLGA